MFLRRNTKSYPGKKRNDGRQKPEKIKSDITQRRIIIMVHGKFQRGELGNIL